MKALTYDGDQQLGYISLSLRLSGAEVVVQISLGAQSKCELKTDVL